MMHSIWALLSGLVVGFAAMILIDAIRVIVARARARRNQQVIRRFVPY